MNTFMKAVFASFLTLTLCSQVGAQALPKSGRIGSFADDPDDPINALPDLKARAEQKSGLVPYSPTQPFRDAFTYATNAIDEAIGLDLGMAFHTVGQGATDVLPGADNAAVATDFDIYGDWAFFNRGEPTEGGVYFGVEGRWDYSTIGPQNLGFASVGTTGGTANSFSAYTPAFLLRNLYYHQGSPEAGWVFRLGKITPDAMLLSNRNLTPNDTFLPNAGTGMFVAGFPDSGLGIAGAIYLTDDLYIGGLVSDANGNRANWGDIEAGDFYKSVEVGARILPTTDLENFTKFLLWHTDGTQDGLPINAQAGPAGWGFGIVAEQQLTSDGRLVLVGRYGKAYDGAAIYDQQAGVHLLLYEPTGRFENDVVGAALNWVDSSAPLTRDEYNFEAFYRFPLLPDLDTTISYQGIFNPGSTAATLVGLNYSSVFSLRMTTSF